MPSTAPDDQGGDGVLTELKPGEMVDGYQVMRQLGRGGMGEVYLARDTQLGRKVALKMVLPSLLSSEHARGQFLAEARTTAKFNHPHIVTVYGVGEHDGRAYLALEYVEGDSLSERIADRLLSVRESLRVGLAIAEALVEAHTHGVLHRDLKPGNVLMGRDGRVRVLDFGMAKVVAIDEGHGGIPDEPKEPVDGEVSQTSAMGTPRYMAPEQWRRERSSRATDVWGLGVVLFAMLARRLPYEEKGLTKQMRKVCADDATPRVDEFTNVPEPVADLVALCLEKEAVDRPSAADTVAMLHALLAHGLRTADERHNPFRGLLPFTRRHAHLFFGREWEVASFVERIRSRAVLPVVGPSGAGKSSFVRAGVIPRLQEQDTWTVIEMRPGPRPFHALALRLIEPLRDETLSSTVGFSGAVGLSGAASLSSSESVTIVSDKGNSKPGVTGAAWNDSSDSSVSAPDTVEEDEPPVSVRHEGPASVTVTYSSDVDERAAQLEQAPQSLALQLRALAKEHGAHILLFVDQLEELFTLCDDGSTRTAFVEALCGAADDALEPVRVVFTVRDDFLGRLALGSVVREALSHVTVVQRPDRNALRSILTRPIEALQYSYEDPKMVDEMVDEVRGEPACLPLLQFAAGQLWEQRDRDERKLLRAAYEEMGGVAGALARHADGVLAGLSADELRLARELLLRLVTVEHTRKIIARQQALAGLPDDADHVLARLTEARLISLRRATRHPDAPVMVELAHESLVVRWGSLARWLEEGKDDLAFLAEAGPAAELWDKRGRRGEELWQGDALHEAERTLARAATEAPELVTQFIGMGRAREDRRRRTRRFALAGILLASLAVTVTAVLVAFFVDEQRDAAEQQRATALREGARAALGQGNVLEARAKLRGSLETQDSTAARAVWRRLLGEPAVWQRNLGATLFDVAFSHDGKLIGTTSQGGVAYLFDANTGTGTILRGHDDQVMSCCFSPDGKLFATSSLDKTVKLWDVASARLLRTLQGHESGAFETAFSHDGRWIAASGYDGTTRLWEVASGKAGPVLLGHEGLVRGVAFSRDDARVLTSGNDKTVRLWQRADGKSLEIMRGHEKEVFGVAFNASGTLIASSAYDETVRIWDASSGRHIRTLHGHEGGIAAVEFHPNGKLLATASADRTLRLWDVATGEQRGIVEHRAQLYAVAFSPDGRKIATAGVGQQLRVFDTARIGMGSIAEGHTGPVNGVAFSLDDKRIASAGHDKTVRLWDSESGRQLTVLEGHNAVADDVEFSPDGKLLASCGRDRTVRLWDSESGEARRVLEQHTGDVSKLSFNPDGAMLASAGYDRSVVLWDVEAGTAIRKLSGHDDRVLGLAFSPNGEILASGSYDTMLRLWDVASGELNATLKGHEGRVYDVEFTADGSQVVSVGYDSSIRRHRVPNPGEEPEPGVVLAKNPGRIYGLSMRPGGGRLATSSSDGIGRVRDDDGKVVAELRGHRSEVNGVSYDHAGKRIATTSDDGTVRLWDAADGRPLWHAPALLRDPVRLVSHRGWQALNDKQPLPPVEHAWQRALASSARYGEQTADAKRLCLLSFTGEAQLWDLAQDTVLARVDNVRELRATADACALLTGDGAQLLHDSGVRKLPHDGIPHAIAYDDGRLLIATAGSVTVMRAAPAGDGAKETTHDVGIGATTMALSERWLIVGYRDGNLALWPRTAGGTPPAFNFERVPASAVLRVLVGPQDTLLVGYGNGRLGMWDLSDGRRLDHAQLNGPVVHLALQNEVLYAATDLGSHTSWDLSVFYATRCELLRQVWSHVGVTWVQGHAREQAPPHTHACKR